MIVCQGIGMSGYVPLEGLIRLSHFFLHDDLVECNYMFLYIVRTDSCAASVVTHYFDVLHKVASLVVVSYFSEFDKSCIIHDVGLLSGYHRAGVMFPRKLLNVLMHAMNMYYHRGWNNISDHPDYDFDKVVCTTALADYVCIDFIGSQSSEPCLSLRMLGSFETILPNLGCEEFLEWLMR